jgi:hypothetical protein
MVWRVFGGHAKSLADPFTVLPPSELSQRITELNQQIGSGGIKDEALARTYGERGAAILDRNKLFCEVPDLVSKCCRIFRPHGTEIDDDLKRAIGDLTKAIELNPEHRKARMLSRCNSIAFVSAMQLL